MPLLRNLAAAEGVKAGLLINATRVAIVGRAVAPPLFDTMVVLGKDRVVARLRRAVTFFPLGSSKRRSPVPRNLLISLRKPLDGNYFAELEEACVKISGWTSRGFAPASATSTFTLTGTFTGGRQVDSLHAWYRSVERNRHRAQRRVGLRREAQSQSDAAAVNVERLVRREREFLELSSGINRVDELETRRKLRRERRWNQICVGGLVRIHVVAARDFRDDRDLKFLAARNRLK